MTEPTPKDNGTPSSKEVALITGAGSGMGAAVAMRLARRGASIVLIDRATDGLARVAEQLRPFGIRTHLAAADVTDDDAMRRVVEEAAALGTLTTVVACAGIPLSGSVVTVEPNDWERCLAVNLTGVYITARNTIAQMVEAGKGSFTAISSSGGLWGAQMQAAYSAAKHGLIGLIKCMALDHGPSGVRSNVICPGNVSTPMFQKLFASATPEEFAEYVRGIPLGRVAEPSEIAEVVAHLSSAEASYTNGTVYALDGGETAGFFDLPVSL